MSRTTSPIEVRTSKLNQSSARSEMTLSWITEHDRYMKAQRDHDDMAWKVDCHHVGYLLKGGPTGLNDILEPRSTLGWGERYTCIIKGSQARAWSQERPLINTLTEAVSFRAKTQLVTATRLQHNSLLFGCVTWVIHHPFWWILHKGLFHRFWEGNALSILQLLSWEAPGRAGTIQDNVAIWTSSTTN
jgi:hypothetical protein